MTKLLRNAPHLTRRPIHHPVPPSQRGPLLFFSVERRLFVVVESPAPHTIPAKWSNAIRSPRALLHFDENARTPSHTNYRPRPRAANGASADWTAANAAMLSPPSRLRGPFVLGPLSARTRRCSGGPTRTDHPPCLKGIMTSRHFT